MKKLLIINTGGTISMSENQLTGKVAPTSENPLGKNANIFDYIGQITSEELFHLPSPHITEKEMLILRARVLLAKEEGFDGVVITHGTDTLEETAYFLELTIKNTIPVVLTGAMRSSNEIGSDGLANLRSALIVAACKDSMNKGVLVVMNDEVHTATYVTKTHTTNLATFQTPTFGPIGLVSKNDVIYFQQLIRCEKYQLEVETDMPKVYLLKAYAGMDSTLIEAVLEKGAKGLVIEALGAGNLPPKTVQGVRKCLQTGIPVVFVSRAFNGVTQDVYDYEGGGKRFKQEGVIFTTGLSGQKARMKLMVLLASGIEPTELTNYFK
ncbi:L-asparaginase [Granulicatella balaenopterae]|uniref:asparaginase n=1 Tax=Granulicatella balaenopterae TaxID=137733 RepID=A0A1H9PC72_9LACT|nr:asparaginase [Granulicatella balaenopterae]SER45173.1 L-asparaginase [Granulicatella balaenopterae]